MVESVNKRIVKITGKSMEPFLIEGYIAFVSQKPQYIVGDIIIFNYLIDEKETLISHRIVFENNDHYLCKSDNSLNIERITFSDILGKIVSVESKGKKEHVEIYIM